MLLKVINWYVIILLSLEIKPQGGLNNTTVHSYMSVRSSFKYNNRLLDYYLQFQLNVVQLAQLTQFVRRNCGKTPFYLKMLHYYTIEWVQKLY